MMSISKFAYRISAVPNMSAKASRRALRTAAVPLIAAAISLGPSPAIAQDREQVKVAFAHALPNVEGKRLVAVTVTYPPVPNRSAIITQRQLLSTPMCCPGPFVVK